MNVTLLHNTPLWVCARSIRTCWASEDKSDTGFCPQCETDAYGYSLNGTEALAECNKCGTYFNLTDCGGKDKALIERVGNKNKHSSVLRHLTYTFHMSGISTKTLLAFTRHKAGVDFSVQCLAGDSNITTSAGLVDIATLYKHQTSLKQLPAIRVYDTNSKVFKYAEIAEVFKTGTKKSYTLTTENGKSITCSKDHKLYRNGEWVRVADINIGDTICTNGVPAYKNKEWLFTYKETKVVSIQPGEDIPMYDIEVNHSSHNYVANGILVHNSTRYTTSKRATELQFTKSGDARIDSKLETIMELVQEAIKEGCSNDAISLLLPQSYEYTFVVTMNAQAIQHFLKLRTTPSAHKQIRDLAHKIYSNLPIEHQYLFTDSLYSPPINITKKELNDSIKLI